MSLNNYSQPNKKKQLITKTTANLQMNKILIRHKLPAFKIQAT